MFKQPRCSNKNMFNSRWTISPDSNIVHHFRGRMKPRTLECVVLVFVIKTNIENFTNKLKSLFCQLSKLLKSRFLSKPFLRTLKQMRLKMVELSRIELLTSCVQGRRSPSWAIAPSGVDTVCQSSGRKIGGSEWTRTTDLSLIRRTL